MKIKDVISKTGLPENTIRFYESRGLVETTTERRNGRTYHEFSEESVQDLQQIIILRKAGFSIEEILKMQRHPGDIPTVVERYQQRLKEEHEIGQRLSTDETLPQAENWHELSRKTERAMTRIQNYESPLRFGQYDPESETEKRAAISSYRKKAKIKDNLLLFITIGLGIICLALVIVLTLMIKKDVETVPAPSGTTEGWIYYRTDNSLTRCKEDGTEKEVIYESSTTYNNISYIVDDEKIYILDDGYLYSINADGSGLHEYPAEIYSTYTNETIIGMGSTFALYEDCIYVGQHQSGTFGGTIALTKVPVDGSKQEKINVDISGMLRTQGCIWDGKLYLYSTYADSYEPEVYMSKIDIYDLETEKRIETLEGDFATCLAIALCFDEDEGYFYRTVENTGTLEYTGTELIRVTPENPEGEVISTGEDLICKMYENYLIKAQDQQGLLTNIYVENLETGATKKLNVNNYFDVECTPLGIVSNSGEFIPYP